jgi:hypothetical protein
LLNLASGYGEKGWAAAWVKAGSSLALAGVSPLIAALEKAFLTSAPMLLEAGVIPSGCRFALAIDNEDSHKNLTGRDADPSGGPLEAPVKSHAGSSDMGRGLSGSGDEPSDGDNSKSSESWPPCGALPMLLPRRGKTRSAARSMKAPPPENRAT